MCRNSSWYAVTVHSGSWGRRCEQGLATVLNPDEVDDDAFVIPTAMMAGSVKIFLQSGAFEASG
jgi:hypothetical protein